MDSSDSMEENVKKIYDRNPTSQQMPSFSSTAESSSDSGSTEKISTPPSNKQQKKSSPNKNKNNISTPSKPSASIKRPRERQEKEGTKPSSKKSKKPAQEDNKGKAMAVPEAEKSAKKSGPIWNAKDEVAFLNRLVACCEKGKGLPKNMGYFYEVVRRDLDGDYSHDQLYNKLRRLKAKFGGARDKIKDKGFVGFKNAHEETVYRMSKQIWGNKEEEQEVGREKVGKGGNARVEEKKKLVVGDEGGEREEVKRNRSGDVEITVKEQEGEEEEDEDEDDGEEEEEGHDQGEQNGKVNLAQHNTLEERNMKRKKEEGASYVSESVHNRVAGTGTERNEENVGEEKDSSEENVGEEKDSSEESEESENESSGKENSALQDSNAAQKLFKSNVRDSSTLRDSNSALKQCNARGNLPRHVLNGVSKGSRRVGAVGHHDARENLSQTVDEGMPDGRRGLGDADHIDARGNLTPNDGSRRIGATEYKNTGENPMQDVGNRMSNGSRRTATTIVRENLTPHVSSDRSNGSRRVVTTDLPNNEENLVQHVSNGMANGSSGIAMADQRQMFDQLCKENSRIMNEFKSQLLNKSRDMFDEFKNEIVNMVKKELQGSSNTVRSTGLDFSMIKGFSSARELPTLSNTEVQMLDQKWQTQQLVEMEATSKHLALLQEEYQLRLAKLRHK